MPDLTGVPASIVAGDSYVITLSLPAYPATAGWAIAFSANGPGAITKAAVPSGDAHVLTLTAAETATLDAGRYQYRLRASKVDGTAETFERGGVVVELDIGAAGPGELQSYAERMLALCKAARENILRGEMKMYMIGGRQVMLHTLADVAKEEAHWRRELSRERRGSAFVRRPVTFVRG
ncbi:MAG: hypothetical protein ACK5X3_00945 [Pseudomonadota bacterium]